MDEERRSGSVSVGGDVVGTNAVVGGSQTFHGDATISSDRVSTARGDASLEALRERVELLLGEFSELSGQGPSAEVVEQTQALEAELMGLEPDPSRIKRFGATMRAVIEGLAGVAPGAVKLATESAELIEKLT